MCIILQNVKRSPIPHFRSNFQENKRFKTYACNSLTTSLAVHCDVSSTFW